MRNDDTEHTTWITDPVPPRLNRAARLAANREGQRQWKAKEETRRVQALALDIQRGAVRDGKPVSPETARVQALNHVASDKARGRIVGTIVAVALGGLTLLVALH